MRVARPITTIIALGAIVGVSASVAATATHIKPDYALPRLHHAPAPALTDGFLGDLYGTRATAVRFVETTGLTRNLSLLLLNEVKQSRAVADAIEKQGFQAVQQIVIRAIKDVQADHAADWGNMLAAIYTLHFSDSELTSIMQEKEQSPHFTKMLQRQSDIAVAVESSGKMIFERAHKQLVRDLAVAFAS